MRQIKKIGKVATKATEGKLFHCRSVFPFDLWPDSIKLDEEKLIVTHREAWVKEIITIQVRDILNIEVVAGPVFASTKILSKYVTGGNTTINWMWKKDAFKLRSRVNELVGDTQQVPHVGGQ